MASRRSRLPPARAPRGTIAVGKLADLVVLRADPLANIRNTHDIELVVKRGRMIERTEH